MNDKEIGKRLRILRNKWGFTQNQIADYLGFKQSQITKLEKGERILKFSSLMKLCDLYGCDQRYIVFGEGEYEMPDYILKTGENLDLKTISKMNCIINNLKEMKDIEKRMAQNG